MQSYLSPFQRWWARLSLGVKQLVVLIPILGVSAVLTGFWVWRALDFSEKAQYSISNLMDSSVQSRISRKARPETITEAVVSLVADQQRNRQVLALHLITLRTEGHAETGDFHELFADLILDENGPPKERSQNELNEEVFVELPLGLKINTTKASYYQHKPKGGKRLELWSQPAFKRDEHFKPLTPNDFKRLFQSDFGRFIMIGDAAVYVQEIMLEKPPDVVADAGSSEITKLYLVSEFDPANIPFDRFSTSSLILTTCIIAMITVGLGMLLQNLVINPIRDLSQTMQRIANDGNYTQTVDVDRRDEIGELQFSLNALLTTIREQDSELRSERDMLDERVKERTLALERSNKELDSFARTVSHDLQEPLRNIKFIIDELSRDWADSYDAELRRKIVRMEVSTLSLIRSSERRQSDLHEQLSLLGPELAEIRTFWTEQIHQGVVRQISEITRQSEREMTMVRRILDISRVGRDLKRIRVDLNEVIEDVRHTFVGRLEASDVSLQADPNLPIVAGDRVLLHQVLMNLISNAIRYNDKAEKIVRITSEPASDPGYSRISVTDNGVGIREKDREKVFELFSQLHSVKQFERGIGAGLTFVKKIVERHGGAIDFLSVSGEGTTFFFTLPVYLESPHAPSGSASHIDRRR